MRYTVKDTHIRHNDRTYGPGSIVELADEEAAHLLHHLDPVGAGEESPDDAENSGEERKRRKR